MNKLIIVLSIFSFFGCNKEPKLILNLEKLRNGEQLHLAKEISVSEFFQIWIRKDIPWKGNMQMIEVYQDQQFVYFFEQLFRNQPVYLGDRTFTKEPQLFKVKAAELNAKFGNYKEIEGLELRKAFTEKINYSKEDKPTRLTADLFKYTLQDEAIHMTIEIGNEVIEMKYDILQKKFF